jgi:hypothetical protein
MDFQLPSLFAVILLCVMDRHGHISEYVEPRDKVIFYFGLQ